MYLALIFVALVVETLLRAWPSHLANRSSEPARGSCGF
jgi:hypothetical protein